MDSLNEKGRKVRHEIIGKQYPGTRLFIDDWGVDHKNRTIYKCTCSCGNKIDVPYQRLKNGRNVSCGCYRSENSKKTIKATYDSVNKTQQMALIDGSSAIQLNQKRSINNTTGVKGVSVTDNNKYRAYITVARKQMHLGTFETFGAAVNARKKAEKKYHLPILDEYEKRKSELDK